MFSIPNEGFCRDCTVLQGKMALEYEDGKPAIPTPDGKGVYIHHILTYDITKRSKSFVSCGSGLASLLSGGIGSKFIGSGEDNNSVIVRIDSGITALMPRS